MIENNKVFKQLEEIKKEYGIEVIEEYIKKSKKSNKRQRGRRPSGLMTGAEVYFELFGLDFEDIESYQFFGSANVAMMITDAKEKVSERKGTRPKTVDKQVTEINKFAEKMNYKEFCKEFNSYRHDSNYEQWNRNDLEGIENHILYYANEREEYDKHLGYSTPKGDNRYLELDIKLAVALFLKNKYDKLKNAHKVPKKTDNTPHEAMEAMQQQQQYQPQYQQQNNNDDDLPF